MSPTARRTDTAGTHCMQPALDAPAVVHGVPRVPAWCTWCAILAHHVHHVGTSGYTMPHGRGIQCGCMQYVPAVSVRRAVRRMPRVSNTDSYRHRTVHTSVCTVLVPPHVRVRRVTTGGSSALPYREGLLTRPSCTRLLTGKCTDVACKRRCTRMHACTYACTQLSFPQDASPPPATEGRLLEPTFLIPSLGVAVRARTSVRARTRSFAVGVAVCTCTSVHAHTRSFAATESVALLDRTASLASGSGSYTGALGTVAASWRPPPLHVRRLELLEQARATPRSSSSTGTVGSLNRTTSLACGSASYPGSLGAAVASWRPPPWCVVAWSCGSKLPQHRAPHEHADGITLTGLPP